MGSMREYFQQRFPKDLAQLDFVRANDVVEREQGGLTLVFGGPGWSNVEADLEVVPSEDRPRFVLLLFMIVLTDQAVYTYLPDVYPEWWRQTRFPKFGSSPFGLNNEDPLILLRAAEASGMVASGELLAEVPDFVHLWLAESGEWFGERLPEVNVPRFLTSITTDRAWIAAEGVVVSEIRKRFGKALLDLGSGAETAEPDVSS